MAPSSKKNKKKSKSKGGKKGHSAGEPAGAPSASSLPGSAPGTTATPHDVSAEVYDPTSEYPTSRVIKVAPNGDVIVSPLADDGSELAPGVSGQQPPMDVGKDSGNGSSGPAQFSDDLTRKAALLDAHWETLPPEAKKNILKIDKEDVFAVIKKYQSHQNCNCAVCGRRHVAIDQEMEKIYSMLYEIDRVRDPELNPVKFHLGIIKELQLSKNSSVVTSMLPPPPAQVPAPAPQDTNTDVIDDFVPSRNTNYLKDEVMHFKKSKQQQQHQQQHQQQSQDAVDEEVQHSVEESAPTQDIAPTVADVPPSRPQFGPEPPLSNESEQETRERYMEFATKFISSHSKIAADFVDKVMAYPEMRAMADNLINMIPEKNFTQALKDFCEEQITKGEGNIKEGALADPVGFTTMLHHGTPLTQEEYSELQRNIADRMTGSYDTKNREFSAISPLEQELFVRFMFGDDRERFENIVLQSFRDKFDHEFGGSSVSASLAAAAAAATLTNPLTSIGATQNDQGIAQYVNRDDNRSDDDNYSYSDYDEEIDEDEEGSEILSDYLDEENSGGLISDYDEDHLDYHSAQTGHNHQGDIHHYHNSDEYMDDHDSYDDENDLDENEDECESELDEADRLEEGRKLLQIAITKLLQGRIIQSYHESQADSNRLKLLQELEDEQKSKEQKKQKKQRKKEKEKEKKRQQQLAKEEEKRKKQEEQERLKKEQEEREAERREAQRKKVEEAKKKKDEEKRRKLEEQRKREEQQERQRKLKEEQKRKREEEKRKKEEEKKLAKEAKSKKQTESQPPAANVATEVAKPEAKASSSNESLPYSSGNKTVPTTANSAPKKPENISDDIASIISAATASQSISTSPSHLQNLLQPHLSASATPGMNTPTQPGAIDMSKIPVEAQQLFPGANSLLSAPIIPGSRQAQFDSLYAPIPGTPVSAIPAAARIPGANFETPLWSSFQTPIGAQNGVNPSLPMDSTPNQNAAGTPLNRLASFSSLNGGIQSQLTFADELNSLTDMLSYSGLNDNTFKSRSIDPMWNSQPGAPLSSHASVPPMANTSPEMMRNSVPSAPIQQRSGSIWNNNPLEQSGQTPLTNRIGGLPGIGNVMPSAQPAIPTTDSANMLPSNIWSETVPQYTTTDRTSPLAANTHRSPGNGYADAILNECTKMQQLDPTQPYVPVDNVYQRLGFLGLDYNSFINVLLQMQGAQDCQLLSGANGTISHIRATRNPMDPVSQGVNGLSHPALNTVNSAFPQQFSDGSMTGQPMASAQQPLDATPMPLNVVPPPGFPQ